MFKINDNITAQSLYNYGFHRKCGDYKLSIPLYRYNGKPLLMLKIYADLEERTLIYKVKDLNTNCLYSAYYDKHQDKNNTVLSSIKEIITDEIEKIQKAGILCPI